MAIVSFCKKKICQNAVELISINKKMTSEHPKNYRHRVVVKAEREIAYESPDHLYPWGTKRDNSRNRRFNRKLYALYPGFKDPMKVLDLGCSGGGFVKDCIDDGYLAVGLEGSDYSKIHRRAEWALIPDFLFTCDITCKFEIFLDAGTLQSPIEFDVVTMWEVFEHIADTDIEKVALNVRKHLKDTGIWVVSISPNDEDFEGIKLHLSVHPKEWWIEKLKKFGFIHMESYVQYFNTQFIRGPKYGAEGTFHLVLSHSPDKAPKIPKESFFKRIMDRWIASKAQKFLKLLVTGEK
ncbi:class I SAM-dependent methyltransferase [bacterium]|nr:MAG: class I SAM-dependent methyltransferase [bacterium]